MSTTVLKKIYFAGPEVFLPNAAEHFAEMAALCAQYNMTALVPLSGRGAADLSDREIFTANWNLLHKADGLVCNVSDFRGSEPDARTVFEIGVARERDLIITGYSVKGGTYLERVQAGVPTKCDFKGILRDTQDFEVENYGNRLNLMLAHSVPNIQPTAARAVELMATLIA